MTATGAVQAGDFGPEHTLDGLTIEGWQDGTPAHPGGTRPGGHQGNHWISGDITAVNNAITASVTYNLGTSFDLSEIRILNTSNTAWNDRETDSFTVATSTDNGGSFGAESAANSLQDYTLGFQTFALTETGVTNVRLTVTNLVNVNDNHEGPTIGADRAVGLNEVQFYQVDPIPEPGSTLLGLLGASFLLRRKRSV